MSRCRRREAGSVVSSPTEQVISSASYTIQNHSGPSWLMDEQFCFSKVRAAGGVVMLCKIIQRAEQLLPKENTLCHRLCICYHVFKQDFLQKHLFVCVTLTGMYVITNHCYRQGEAVVNMLKLSARKSLKISEIVQYLYNSRLGRKVMGKIKLQIAKTVAFGTTKSEPQVHQQLH